MASSMNIEQLIEEIQVYIDNSKSAGVLSGGSMVKINRDELISMLDEIKLQLPSEIKESKSIIESRDSIIAEARSQAQKMIEDAAKEAGKMIDQNEIVALSRMRAAEIDADAESQANKKIRDAKDKAQSLQLGALQYTQTVLGGLEDLYSSMIEQEKNYFNSIIAKLQDEYKSVQENKYEIDIQLNGTSSAGKHSSSQRSGRSRKESDK